MNPILIGLLAGTAMGAIQGGEKQKQEKEDRKERKRLLREEKERQRYNWWTGGREGQTPAEVKKTSMMSELMKGGMAGAMFGQNLGDGATPPATGTTAVPAQAPTYTPGQGEPPWAVGDQPPQAAAPDFDQYYQRPQQAGSNYNMTQPEHELAYTAQGKPRRVSSPGAVGNFYPYGK